MTTSNNQKYAARLRYHLGVLRAERGWSYERVANEVTSKGVVMHASTPYKIEKGQPPRTVFVDEWMALAEVFDVDPMDLVAPTPDEPEPVEERLTIYMNSNVTRGKAAAGAVHAALAHYGIPHGAVICLGAKPPQIEEECTSVIRDAGRTEVEPGTITAGVKEHTNQPRSTT